MALTTEQTLALFRILEIPYADEYAITDRMGLSVVNNTTDAASAKGFITTKLAALSSAVELLLAGYLTAYLAIRAAPPYELDGNIGEITGIRVSSERQIEELRKDVLNVMPYYQWHLHLQKEQGDSLAIGVLR